MTSPREPSRSCYVEIRDGIEKPAKPTALIWPYVWVRATRLVGAGDGLSVGPSLGTNHWDRWRWGAAPQGLRGAQPMIRDPSPAQPTEAADVR